MRTPPRPGHQVLDVALRRAHLLLRALRVARNAARASATRLCVAYDEGERLLVAPTRLQLDLALQLANRLPEQRNASLKPVQPKRQKFHGIAAMARPNNAADISPCAHRHVCAPET